MVYWEPFRLYVMLMLAGARFGAAFNKTPVVSRQGSATVVAVFWAIA